MSAPPSPQGYKKGFATIVDANVVTLLVAFILFILATAGVNGFAFMLGLGTIVSLFTAVLATQAILLSLRGTKRAAGAVGAGRRPSSASAHLRLHGRVEVVLLDVGRDPAHRRARDRRQGPELRHRLRVRHADHRLAGAGGDRRAGARRDRAGGLRRREDPDASRTRSSARTSSRSRRRAVGPHERRSRTRCDSEFGLAEQPIVEVDRPDVRASRSRTPR